MTTSTGERKKYLGIIMLTLLVIIVWCMPAVSAPTDLIHTIQIGSYAGPNDAQGYYETVMEKLNEQELEHLRIEKIGSFYAVRLGKFDSYSQAKTLHQSVKPIFPAATIMTAYIKEKRLIKIHITKADEADKTRAVVEKKGTLSAETALVHTIQIGSYAGPNDAQGHYDTVTDNLNEEQLDHLRIEKIGRFYALRLGKFATYSQAKTLLQTVKPIFPSASIMTAYIKEKRLIQIYTAQAGEAQKAAERQSPSPDEIRAVPLNEKTGETGGASVAEKAIDAAPEKIIVNRAAEEKQANKKESASIAPSPEGTVSTEELISMLANNESTEKGKEEKKTGIRLYLFFILLALIILTIIYAVRYARKSRSQFTVQTGCFASQEEAQKQYKAVAVAIKPHKPDSLRIEMTGTNYVVRLGKFNSHDATAGILKKLESQFPAVMVMEISAKDTIRPVPNSTATGPVTAKQKNDEETTTIYKADPQGRLKVTEKSAISSPVPPAEQTISRPQAPAVSAVKAKVHVPEEKKSKVISAASDSIPKKAPDTVIGNVSKNDSSPSEKKHFARPAASESVAKADSPVSDQKKEKVASKKKQQQSVKSDAHKNVPTPSEKKKPAPETPTMTTVKAEASPLNKGKTDVTVTVSAKKPIEERNTDNNKISSTITPPVMKLPAQENNLSFNPVKQVKDMFSKLPTAAPEAIKDASPVLQNKNESLVPTEKKPNKDFSAPDQDRNALPKPTVSANTIKKETSPVPDKTEKTVDTNTAQTPSFGAFTPKATPFSKPEKDTRPAAESIALPDNHKATEQKAENIANKDVPVPTPSFGALTPKATPFSNSEQDSVPASAPLNKESFTQSHALPGHPMLDPFSPAQDTDSKPMELKAQMPVEKNVEGPKPVNDSFHAEENNEKSEFTSMLMRNRETFPLTPLKDNPPVQEVSAEKSKGEMPVVPEKDKSAVELKTSEPAVISAKEIEYTKKEDKLPISETDKKSVEGNITHATQMNQEEQKAEDTIKKEEPAVEFKKEKLTPTPDVLADTPDQAPFSPLNSQSNPIEKNVTHLADVKNETQNKEDSTNKEEPVAASTKEESSEHAESQPETAETYFDLGNACNGKPGMDEDAIEAYKKAIALKPDFAEAHYCLGLVYIKSGMPQEAINAYKMAIELNQDHGDAHFRLGIVYSKSGMDEEAIEAFKQSVELNPEHAAAHFNLGIAYRKSGMLEEAIKCYKQTVTLNSDHANAYFNLGIVYSKTGRYKYAIDAYKQALEIKPDFAKAHYNLGIAYIKSGMHENAVTAYEQAIAIKPDFKEARQSLEAVKSSKGIKGTSG